MPASSSGLFARSAHPDVAPREADAQRALADLFPHLKSASLQAARQQRQAAPLAPSDRAAAPSARFLLG